ncbi:MAG: hypothetical protein GY940_00650, partial [bacterium]|nr:hypothetical protein [bacterium]
MLKVTGSSLLPDYRDGDFVVTFKIPVLKKRFRPGDVVVFHHPQYGLMIKRVDAVSHDGSLLTVTGTHPHSIDSRDFGPVKKEKII